MPMKQNPVDISAFSVEALKALAYDLIAQIQVRQKDLDIVNTEIAKKIQLKPNVEDTERVEPETKIPSDSPINTAKELLDNA